MSECKHGLRHGCAYCHGSAKPIQAAASSPSSPRRTRATRLSESMNDRMTALKRRLREIRGD